MKVSFSELNDFLFEPEEWAQTKLTANSRPRMSYAHVTRMAAYRFHQKSSRAAAMAALSRYLDSYHLVNVDKRALAEEQLSRYMTWAESSAPIVVGVETRVRVDLGSGIFTSGHVHRVDLDLGTGGYRAVLLGSPIASSKDPRAAILQLGYAGVSKREPNLIRPAWQNLDGSGLTVLKVDNRARQDLMESLKEAASIAAATLAKARR